MNDRGRVHFVSCYARILTRAWCDDAFAESLIRDPVRVLAEQGLALPSGAQARVVRLESYELNWDLQLGLWDDGASSGRYVLLIPVVNDMTDGALDGVSGGVALCRCHVCAELSTGGASMPSRKGCDGS